MSSSVSVAGLGVLGPGLKTYYVYMSVRMYVCMYVHLRMHVCMYVCMYVCMLGICVYMPTYIHTCMHTYMQIFERCLSCPKRLLLRCLDCMSSGYRLYGRRSCRSRKAKQEKLTMDAAHFIPSYSHF